MRNDPIVEEVRRAREQIFAECDHDLDKLFARLRREQMRHPERVVKSVDAGKINRDKSVTSRP